MKALFFSDRLYLTREQPEPVPNEDEALIRIKYAGICNTDLEIIKGYMGFSGILGHEFVGNIKWAKDERLIGKRVVSEINIGCGKCLYCKKHMQNHCPDRSVVGILNRDGVFAEYTTLPLNNLHFLPDSVSDIEAVFIEPLAAAFQILKQIEIKPSDRVCILGDGKLGLLAGQIIAMTGCNLIIVGKHSKKLSVLQKMGINTCLHSEFDEKGFDIVIDCTGSSSGIKNALDIVRPKGKIIVKTTVAGQKRFDLNRVVINELTIIGSRCGPFPQAIRAIEDRVVDVKPLISACFSLEEGIKAFKYARRRDVLKVLLKTT